jgi:geranylgeranyl diphosphate synthase type II
MLDLRAYLEERRTRVNRWLDERLPAEQLQPVVLHQAMRYSMLGEAKRLRPILSMAAAEAVGGQAEAALLPGAAIEVLHTFTLIHDDLPSMDNDDLRRGRPTCHKVFGEANAILAGDALLILAFEWLAECVPPPPYPPTQLVLELARASGHAGVIAGQVEDIAAEGKPVDAKLVDYIHRHKTADLLRAAVRMGGITVGASPEALAGLDRYGDRMGLAFQVADDVLNATAQTATLGKGTGTDAARGKLTYVAVHGLAGARTRARALIDDAQQALAGLPGDTTALHAIADYVVSRTT